MKRNSILLIALLLSLSTYSEVKILSAEAWTPTLSGSWSAESGLSYSNTVYGDTYYNPEYQNKDSDNIAYKTVTRHFQVKPDRKRDWCVEFTLSNLNAEQGYSYWAKSNPKQKQHASQIYWGVLIGYKANGVNRTSKIWFKRSYHVFSMNGYIIDVDDDHVEYNFDDNGWEVQFAVQYPSCASNSAPKFSINSYPKTNRSFIQWGGCIESLPVYIEEIRYIKILVGTQAKIQIGKPSVIGQEIKQADIYDASEYMETENYAMVVRKLYNAENTYYEQPAVNLAWAYASLNELDKALEICNALVNFKGVTLNYAYSLRGILKEVKGDTDEALEDYMMANDMENYNRLQEEIKAQQLQEQQKKQQQQKKSTKPTLTK